VKVNPSMHFLVAILSMFLATSVLAQSKNYTELNNLVVVYYNSNGGSLPADLVSSGDLQYALDGASLFYWRHSQMSVNLKWTILEVTSYVNFPELADNYLFPDNVDADLNARGIMDGSYDAVYALAANSGNFAWGVTSCLGNAGFCQTGWWGKEYGVWAIIHEYNHVVDAFFQASGYPEYPHNHPGAARSMGEYVPNSGGNYDLNVEILKYWPVEKWLGLPVNGAWGTILSTTDSDGDGVPDADASLPLDEQRLASKPNVKDSDNDGLDDLGEAMAGMFSSANLNAADTDGDGITDPDDQYPLCPCKTTVPFGTFILSSLFESWPLLGHTYFDHPEAGANADLRMGWDKNYLYIGVKVPEIGAGNLILQLDCNGDGLFHGPDNLEIVLSQNTITSVLLRDADGAPPGWDFAESQLSTSGYVGKTELGSNWKSYRIAVPRDTAHGLDLTVGERIGVRVLIDYYGEMFESDRYFNVQLAKSKALADDYAEDAMGTWAAWAEDGTATLTADGVDHIFGSSSIKLETTGGFDNYLRYPAQKDMHWNLNGNTDFTICFRAENTNIGFQNLSPWIRLCENASNYFQYQPFEEILNWNNNIWKCYTIPLAGDAKWNRTQVGSPNLSDINYIEIHADTWEYGFRLWVDGFRFSPSDGDNDGLPDTWEYRYFGSLNQGMNGDFDKDGRTNYQEYLANTDPTIRNPRPLPQLQLLMLD